jgi:hypothetical protein
MKVIDPEGRQWEIIRRFAPWRRWVQPFALLKGGYRHYKVTADWTLYLNDLPNNPKDSRAGDENGPVEKAVYGLLGVVGLAEGLVEGLFYLLFGLVLLPVRLLEMLAQVVVGTVAQAVRRFRKAPERVDVAGWNKDRNGLVSLAILKVHGDLAGPLVAELGSLFRDRVRFDPGDPVVHDMLTRFGARVERHRTLIPRRAPRIAAR